MSFNPALFYLTGNSAGGFVLPKIAYGLRKINSGYGGSAIRIRRSSDNAQTDIGFSGNDLDTAAITSFVGANSAFIVTWYDQVGSINATQVTSSIQPRIVNAGTIHTIGGKPCIDFGSITQEWRLDFSTAIFAAKNLDVFSVMSIRAFDTFGVTIFRNITDTIAWQIQSAFCYAQSNDGQTKIIIPNIGNSVVRLLNLYSTTVWKKIAINTTEYSTPTSGNATISSGTKAFQIGATSSGTQWALDGTMQELLIYDTLQTKSRIGIKNNINAYYTIY